MWATQFSCGLLLQYPTISSTLTTSGSLLAGFDHIAGPWPNGIVLINPKRIPVMIKHVFWLFVWFVLQWPLQLPAQVLLAPDSSLVIWVNGVCGMCQERIENAALLTPGVRFAHWDVDSRELAVTLGPEPFVLHQLHHNIAAVGHDTEEETASDEAYQNLHDCCKYRDESVIAAHRPVADRPGEVVHGQVLEAGEKGRPRPLSGVNLYWVGTSIGVTTDEHGHFEITTIRETDKLVASYVGYGADTLVAQVGKDIRIVLSGAVLLDGVEVRHRRKPTEISFVEPINVLKVGEKELMKAACCNLSESFETTPAVDVTTTDAVTGARQVQMLGLASPYIQITRENMPDVRGLSAINGMAYTAGPWVEGMMLNMGAGSVANGFEAIAGQINVELRKPERTDRLYLNLYANGMSRLEVNAVASQAVGEKLHTGLLLHAKNQKHAMDNNGDGFLDNPISEGFVVVNRWKLVGDEGLEGQAGVKATFFNEASGQHGFHLGDDVHSGHIWGAQANTRRLEGWFKMGKAFPQRPYSSIGLQLSGLYHRQDAFFGLRGYDANQHSAYANLIYQSIIGDTDHAFKTGMSFQWDAYDELLAGQPYIRNEWVPGAFFEYTYKFRETFTAVAGLRLDYHNIFGAFVTPRLHLRYALNDKTVLRASAGRGQRTASIFAENIGVLASARSITIHGESPGRPYGMDAEVAWNYGLNFTRELAVASRIASLNLSLYRTFFINQIVADYDQSPRELHFYNLDGRSYSNSLQLQFELEPLPRWDIRLAYRFNDVRVSYTAGEMEKPLLARHRAFLNTAYTTPDNWSFDITLNWQGAKRIPGTTANPEAYRMPERSPGFLMANAQVSKNWKDKFELYTGVENIFGFTQKNPIIASDGPFGPYFDSSLVWGPVFGRNIYAGLRYRLQHQEK